MESRAQKYLHTIKEAADLMGVGRTTMYELINGGQLKVTQIGPRGIRVSDDEIRRYINENTESR